MGGIPKLNGKERVSSERDGRKETDEREREPMDLREREGNREDSNNNGEGQADSTGPDFWAAARWTRDEGHHLRQLRLDGRAVHGRTRRTAQLLQANQRRRQRRLVDPSRLRRLGRSFRWLGRGVGARTVTDRKKKKKNGEEGE